jgi:hypothetical protein
MHDVQRLWNFRKRRRQGYQWIARRQFFTDGDRVSRGFAGLGRYLRGLLRHPHDYQRNGHWRPGAAVHDRWCHQPYRNGPNVDSFAFLSNLFASSYQINSGGITGGTEADFFGDGPTSGTVTFYIPFTYGVAFGSELHLESAAGFASSSSDSTPYTATADYYNTAMLNSALVFSGTPLDLGAENSQASIASASGIDYEPGGISAVPEPATFGYVGATLIGLTTLRLRQRRKS